MSFVMIYNHAYHPTMVTLSENRPTLGKMVREKHFKWSETILCSDFRTSEEKIFRSDVFVSRLRRAILLKTSQTYNYSSQNAARRTFFGSEKVEAKMFKK